MLYVREILQLKTNKNTEYNLKFGGKLEWERVLMTTDKNSVAPYGQRMSALR